MLSPDQGIAFTPPWLHPGKADLLYKHSDDDDLYNAMFWSPTFKGGVGFRDLRDDNGFLRDTTFGGGYLRPLAGFPDRGDLILGGAVVEDELRTDYEVQGEYRLPMGLGFGGGWVRREAPPMEEVSFGKITWRSDVDAWHYILELQGQEVDSTWSPGGYGAVYNDAFLLAGGTDGEQWRSTVGWITPDLEWSLGLRPTAEVLYVDNSIGDHEGPRVWFANAALGYIGRFMGHPSRLGRAMGPQGLEFGNPLGFLQPTWNRRLDLWELGRLMTFRAEHILMPLDQWFGHYETALFPFQWFPDTPAFLDGLFLGAGHDRSSSGAKEHSLLGGCSGRLAFLEASVAIEHSFKSEETRFTLGVIDNF